ncbi:hypothetical protein LTR09_007223 [Extremus antarcticus]|uniref:Major facilitator superfamily (MFS) profile domain-containing protein n=1 Tax=Extremus antarcticus TaxID=702011 RepID=A0AAJ0DJG8_9PEZI|nr:hypothetical protein LTR09_007223 [Extremus antarcticus]
MDNQVKNSPLHVAPKSSSQFTWYNLRVCFLISLAPLAFGYCVSIVSSTLGQPSFLLYMGLVDPETFEPTKNASSIEGAMSAMFFAGAVCGVLTSSYVIDKWGRKAGILFCSVFSIIGTVMCCAAQNPGMFIASDLFWESVPFLSYPYQEFIHRNWHLQHYAVSSAV